MPQLGLHVEVCVIGVVTCVNAERNTCCDRAVSHLMCIITSWHAMWISVWRGFYFPEAKFGCSKIKNVSIGNDWMFCFFFRTAFCFGNDLFIWSHVIQSVVHICPIKYFPACVQQICLFQAKTLTISPPPSLFQVSNKGEMHIHDSRCLYWALPVWCAAYKGASLSFFQGSPTNNVSPTSTPAKSSNAVPALQPPPGETAAAAAAAAPEPAEEWVTVCCDFLSHLLSSSWKSFFWHLAIDGPLKLRTTSNIMIVIIRTW